MRPDNEGALAPYLRALRAHKLAVVLALLSAVAGAAAWLSVRTPDYEASAEILVTPLPQDDSIYLGLPLVRDSGEPTRTMQTAARLVESPEAAALAAQRIGGGSTREQVRQAVTVEPKGESNILDIRAEGASPEQAARVANEFARAALTVRRQRVQRQISALLPRLEQRRRQLTDPGSEAISALDQRIIALENVREGNDPTLSISEPATPPDDPLGAPAWLVIVLAVLAGSAFGAGLALLMELAERRVRDEEELLLIYPLPVLARVPRLRRRELRRSSAAMPPGVREAFRTLQTQLDVRGQGARTLVVTSASRDDGKTTSALNLALSLVAGGSRVVLLDFDLRKPDIARHLGIPPGPGLSAMLSPDTRFEDILVSAPQLPLLQVATSMGTEGDVALLEALIRRVPHIFEQALARAEYVVVDTPPIGEVSDALKLAAFADEIILVTRPGNTNRVNLQQARDLFESAGRTPTGYLVIGERPGASNAYYAYGRVEPRRPLTPSGAA